MNDPFYIAYQSAMILSLFATVFMVVLVGQRRQSPGAKSMMALGIALFIWTMGFLLEANSSTLERQLLFNNIGYIGSMAVPTCWFFFAIRYTSEGRWVQGWKKVSLFAILPLLILALVWSNNLHHLMWYNEHLSTSGPFTITVKTYGPFFWIAVAYNYALIGAGAIILIRRLFVGKPLYAGQAVSLLVAVIVPLVWNILYVFHLELIPRKDLTPVMFTVSTISIALGLMRFQLFRVVPFAHKVLFQQLKDGILVLDMENRLLEANSSALYIFGMEKNAVGKRIEYLPALSPLLEQLPSIDSKSIELPMMVSGEKRTYEMQAVPMRNSREQQVGWLAILHDVSERKQAEDKIKSAYAAETELRQKLEAEIDKRVEFTRALVHELKTPLTPVMASSELLVEELKQEPWLSLARNINQGADTLSDRIDELMDISKGELGMLKMTPDTVNPLLLLQDVAQHIKAMLSARGQTLTLELPPSLNVLRGDEGRLRQVLLNLLNNASKFTPKGGKITLRAAEQDNSLIVEVQDTGQGISLEDQQRLFTPYHRLERDRERFSGLGLGLALSKMIVELHGGKIWVESEPGKGSTFGFSVPLGGVREP